jgi:hypothetical protein
MADAAPPAVMRFPDLDTAESALDWIGLEATEGGDGATGWFEGELDDDAAERLDATWDDHEAPHAVRALAGALRERWRDPAAPRAWRVTYPA